MRRLDLDQLRAFVTVAELRSFTAAGLALATTQSGVSLRISKLEKAVGRQLLARSPRGVATTPDGERFLANARAILAAHDRALVELDGDARPVKIRLGVSDHALGAHLVPVLASLRASRPQITPEVTVGLSHDMRALYDAGEVDAAIVRRESGRNDGIPLFRDSLSWMAASSLSWSRGQPVPLIALTGPCGVKAAAIAALEDAGISWSFAFLGGSVLALKAAVQAGLGIAAMSPRHRPESCVLLDEFLPALPVGEVAIHIRLGGADRKTILNAFRSANLLRAA